MVNYRLISLALTWEAYQISVRRRLLMQSRTVYHWQSRRDDRAITLRNSGNCRNPDPLRLSLFTILCKHLLFLVSSHYPCDLHHLYKAFYLPILYVNLDQK